MKGKLKVILLIISAIALCVVLYFFSPIGTNQKSLSQIQQENLCKEFNKEYDYCKEEYKHFSGTAQTAFKILGVKSHGKIKTVYGYMATMYYIKAKDKAYDVCGEGASPFMIDIKTKGDDVQIVKEYGDGITSESIFEEMPLRYRFKALNYNPYDSECYSEIFSKINQKVEDVLGVPVDEKYNLLIEEDKYQIFDIDEQGNTEIKEKGKLSDLY